MIQQRIPSPSLKTTSVERYLQWAFGAEKAQLDPPKRDGTIEAPWYMGYGSVQHAMLEIAILGVRIDKSPSGTTFAAWDNPHVHWDAETAAAVVVNSLERRMADTVYTHAKAGTRPTWMPGAVPKIIPAEWNENQYGRTPATVAANPAFWKGGVWRKWMDEARQSRKAANRAPVSLTAHEMAEANRTHLGRCTPIVCQSTADQIKRARDHYLAWWAALEEIRERLVSANMLRSYVLTGEMPPAQPWENE